MYLYTLWGTVYCEGMRVGGDGGQSQKPTVTHAYRRGHERTKRDVYLIMPNRDVTLLLLLLSSHSAVSVFNPSLALPPPVPQDLSLDRRNPISFNQIIVPLTSRGARLTGRRPGPPPEINDGFTRF